MPTSRTYLTSTFDHQSQDVWTTVSYQRPDSDRQRLKRFNARQRRREDLEKANESPMAEYEHYKRTNAAHIARQLARNPKYTHLDHKQLNTAALAIIGNSRLPLVLDKSAKKPRRNNSPTQSPNNDTDTSTKAFSKEFIDKIVRQRNSLNLTQAELGLRIKRSENDVQRFEKGELPYDPAFKSMVNWKLGL